LLGGNWNIKATAGKVFKFQWFPVIPDLDRYIKIVRYWDFASSEKENIGDDPDWTASVKAGLLPSGDVDILHAESLLGTPAEVDRALITRAAADGYNVAQHWQRDPGQAGVYQDAKLRSLLHGFNCGGIIRTISKYEAIKPLSRAAEHGEVRLVFGDWNQPFLNELTQYPDGAHDDFCDAAAGAYNTLTGEGQIGGSSTGRSKM
jgi:predicted phage terminase large subunit-like protein